MFDVLCCVEERAELKGSLVCEKRRHVLLIGQILLKKLKKKRTLYYTFLKT